MAGLEAPTLELVAELSVSAAAPIEAGEVMGVGLSGRRRIIPITGGTVRGWQEFPATRQLICTTARSREMRRCLTCNRREFLQRGWP